VVTVTSARDQQIRALFRAALERPLAERASFVADLAGTDDELRRSVDSLLTQHDATSIGDSASRGRPNQADELPIGSELSHYRIDGVVGRGGMGVVYRATDTRLGRAVAIKFLSAAVADAEATRRFRQEAKTASSLNHPHIVTVYDVGEHDGRYYIVSELVDGGTLDDWGAAKRRTWRQSVELLTGVADGLAAAHAAGVLHRDVKPGNILIGSNGYAKLGDFGLAKLVDLNAADLAVNRERAAHTTRAGVVVGTVAYMSPEQASGQPLDARSDIFSFGVVLYELLAGRRPFEAKNDLGVLKAIAHGAPPPLPDDVPEFLQIAAEKALEKDPADRYQSMRDLVVDLRRVTRKPTSSQSAVSASDARVVAALVKRHPGSAFGAALLLVLAVTSATYFAFSRVRPPTSPTAAPAVYQMTPLTASGVAQTPAISRDAKLVAYAQLADQLEETPTSSIWMRNIATSSTAPLVRPEAGVSVFAPTITPDGNYVDFLRRDPGAFASALWRVEFPGGSPRLLVSNVASPIGWSPDGKEMAFVHIVPGSSTLVVAKRDGSGERTLATREPPRYFIGEYTLGTPLIRPAWSPDGRVVALYELDVATFKGRITFVDVATGKDTVALAPDGALDGQGLAWLDAKSLVLSQPGTRGQRVQLWRMSYPDGTLSPLTNDLSSYVGVDVDGARTSLVTSRREATLAVWVGDANGVDGAEIVPPTSFYGTPRVQWVGERVFYDSEVNGQRSITSVMSNGSASEQLVPDAFAMAATSNGDTIVFMRGAGLWKSSGSTRRQSRLVEQDAVVPVVTPDDRSIVFLSARTGRGQSPWIVSIDGGEPEQIDDAEAAVDSVDVSSSGRLVFIGYKDVNDVLVVCDLPRCTNRGEFPLPPNFREPWARWTPDGEEVAYIDRRGMNIWSLPLNGKPPHEVTHFADTPGSTISGFAWSRDGRRLAVLRSTVRNDVALLRLRPQSAP